MLMEGLAHVGREDEVVLVLFVYVVHTEAFPSRIGKAGNDVAADYLALPLLGVSLYLERCFSGVLDPVMVVYALAR